MSSTLLIGYNPNDFFYSNAVEQGVMPSDADCKILAPNNITWDTSCNPINFPNYGEKCINKELCKNKDVAETTMALESSHSGSDEKYYNTKEQYDELFMNTANLGIGILFLIGMIFRNG